MPLEEKPVNYMTFAPPNKYNPLVLTGGDLPEGVQEIIRCYAGQYGAAVKLIMGGRAVFMFHENEDNDRGEAIRFSMGELGFKWVA